MQDYAIGFLANACHLGAILNATTLTPDRRSSQLAGFLFALALPLSSVLQIQNQTAFYAGLLTIPTAWAIQIFVQLRQRPLHALQQALKWGLLFSLSNVGILLFRIKFMQV